MINVVFDLIHVPEMAKPLSATPVLLPKEGTRQRGDKSPYLCRSSSEFAGSSSLSSSLSEKLAASSSAAGACLPWSAAHNNAHTHANELGLNTDSTCGTAEQSSRAVSTYRGDSLELVLGSHAGEGEE